MQVLRERESFRERLCTIEYANLSDYIFLLRRTCELLARRCTKTLIFLAAAVSDFFIPSDQMVRKYFLISFNPFHAVDAMLLNRKPIKSSLRIQVWF